MKITANKPVQLQLNNSGAWKTIARFDADDAAAGDCAQKGALLIFAADSNSKFRIATAEALPSVLLRLENGEWRRA